jgi:hypothetical protein
MAKDESKDEKKLRAELKKEADRVKVDEAAALKKIQDKIKEREGR